MSAIQRVTTVELCAERLRERILLRDLLPGTRITEEHFASELQVSRATIRQALAVLENEGLVTRNASSRVLEVTELSAQDVSDIYRARVILEGAGVEAAATDEYAAFQALDASLQAMREAVESRDVFGFVQADGACHAAIVQFLGSPLLSRVHAEHMTRLRLAMSRLDDPGHDLATGLRHHEDFADLLRAGELAEAKAALVTRLHAGERAMVEDIQSDE